MGVAAVLLSLSFVRGDILGDRIQLNIIMCFLASNVYYGWITLIDLCMLNYILDASKSIMIDNVLLFITEFGFQVIH